MESVVPDAEHAGGWTALRMYLLCTRYGKKKRAEKNLVPVLADILAVLTRFPECFYRAGGGS